MSRAKRGAPAIPIKEMVSRAKRGAPAMSDQGNGVPSKARGTGYVRLRKWCPEQSKAHHLSTTKEIVPQAKHGAPTSLSCSGAAFECTPATFSAVRTTPSTSEWPKIHSAAASNIIAGKGATWTAARRPVQLIWIEQHASLSSARKRENQIKRWSHAKKEALIGTTLALTSTHA